MVWFFWVTYATELVNNYRWRCAIFGRSLLGRSALSGSGAVWSFMKVTLPIMLPNYEALVHSRLEPLGEPASSVFGSGFTMVGQGSTGQTPMLQVETTQVETTGRDHARSLEAPVRSIRSTSVAADSLGLLRLAAVNWRDYRC